MSYRLHKFKVRQFEESHFTPRFYFYFDSDLVFKKARVEQLDIGNFDFTAVIPFEEKAFTEKDWLLFDCDEIAEEILEDHNNFVSFTRQLVIHLLGEEDQILSYLGYNNKRVDMGEWIKEGVDGARS